jgi:hypothetical protein
VADALANDMVLHAFPIPPVGIHTATVPHGVANKICRGPWLCMLVEPCAHLHPMSASSTRTLHPMSREIAERTNPKCPECGFIRGDGNARAAKVSVHANNESGFQPWRLSLIVAIVSLVFKATL